MSEINKRPIRLLYLIILAICAASQIKAMAGNPILKNDEPGFLYTADPAAEVFNDRVYVYCSHDQSDAENFRSMQDYVVLESKDLKSWINHGVVLKPREYPWASGQMNAPDVAYRDGWYYFYFPYEKTHIGVAKSKSPVGPWSEAVTNKITTIFDPCVFVDDDGQAYIYGNDHKVDIGDPGWHVMGARLKPNMIELDGPWHRLSEETVNEAVSVFKRKGKYYFMARKDKKTVYFMSDSPLPTKPYATFKGAVTKDVEGAPAHTSAIEFNGQWYLFYHLGKEVNRGSFHRRSVCFDKMEFNGDGTIRPVVFTLEKSGSQGKKKQVIEQSPAGGGPKTAPQE